jgi:hypothetical protein
MAAQRMKSEKRHLIFCWVAGLFFLVAAVVGLLVTLYYKQTH